MMKKVIANAARVLFGLVFVFSGFVKAIDPLGSAYKIEEYLAPLGIEWLSNLALAGGIVLPAVEFLIGACLLMGLWSRLTGLFAILFMAVMTPLTLYIALFNPVTDCGCFGDALVIGNWETFWKNIVLSALAVIIFVWHKEISPVFKSCRVQVAAMLAALAVVLAIAFYGLYYLPIIDFRPYAIGTHLPDKMTIPDDAPRDVYDPATFVYSKDGAEREFTLVNGDFPDSSYTFVRVGREAKLLKKGYEPPIHDFVIELPNEGDITQEVLESRDSLFLLVVYDAAKASRKHAKELNAIYEFASRKGYSFYALTASPEEDVEKFRADTGAAYPFASMDATPLKTMIRSNPGLVLLRGGTVLGKWSHNDLPK